MDPGARSTTVQLRAASAPSTAHRSSSDEAALGAGIVTGEGTGCGYAQLTSAGTTSAMARHDGRNPRTLTASDYIVKRGSIAGGRKMAQLVKGFFWARNVFVTNVSFGFK